MTEPILVDTHRLSRDSVFRIGSDQHQYRMSPYRLPFSPTPPSPLSDVDAASVALAKVGRKSLKPAESPSMMLDMPASSIVMRISSDSVTPITPLTLSAAAITETGIKTPDLALLASNVIASKARTHGTSGRTLLQMYFQSDARPAAAAAPAPVPARSIVPKKKAEVSCFVRRHASNNKALDLVRCADNQIGLPIADMLLGKAARCVGKGSYGSVYAVELEPNFVPLVCKTVRHFDSWKPEMIDSGTRLEAVVSAVLTDEFVLAGSPFNVPNFCTLLGFDLSLTPLAFKYDEGFTDYGLDAPCTIVEYERPPPTNKDDDNNKVCVSSQLYFENCQGGTLLDVLTKHAVASQSRAKMNMSPRMSEAQEQAFVGSVCAQVLCAIATGGSIKVTHNDLTLNNIFVRYLATDGDGDAAMQYQLSAKDFVLTVPLGPATMLLAVGDYGLASIDNWRDDFRMGELTYGRQKRVKDGEMKTLPQRFYYANETNALIHTKLTNLMLKSVAHPTGQNQPLRFLDLGPYERDMATFLSGINALMQPFDELARKHAPDSPLRWCRLMHDFTTDALKMLTEMRPQCYVDQVLFIHRLFARSELFSSWLQPPAAGTRIANVARLPRVNEGDAINKRLLGALKCKSRVNVRYTPETFDMAAQFGACDSDDNESDDDDDAYCEESK